MIKKESVRMSEMDDLQDKYGDDTARIVLKMLDKKVETESNIVRNMVVKILSSPIRKAGAGILRDRFTTNLRNTGVSVARIERILYKINAIPVWLMANGMTLKTRCYWNAIEENYYKNYVRENYIVLLCGCEETAIIVPPEVHNELFIPGRLLNKDTKIGVKWYSFVITPKEDRMELQVKSQNLNLNKFLNNYSYLGITLEGLPSTDEVIAAQYMAADILNDVFKSTSKEVIYKQKRGRPPKGRKTLDDDTILSKTLEIFSEIDSFLNGTTSRDATPEEIFLWIWLCYRFEFYERDTKLFRKINKDEFPDELYKRIERIGYICERRME